MMKIFTPLVFACVISWLAACSGGGENDPTQAPVPRVKTVQVSMDSQSVLELSGNVRARFETPVAFQLDGLIETRHINAGQHVAKGHIWSAPYCKKKFACDKKNNASIYPALK